MIQKENNQVAVEYKQRISNVVEGRRVLLPADYKRDYSFYHISEGVGLCIMASYLARTQQVAPPLPYRTALKFYMGRVFERGISTPERIFNNGIGGEIDDYKEDAYIRELKSTHESIENFKIHKHWTEQLMCYLYMKNSPKGDIVVLFWAGNLMSYTPWGAKEIAKEQNKKWGDVYFQGLQYNPIDIKAWSLEFTRSELEENWTAVVGRIEYLKECINTTSPPSKEAIEERLPCDNNKYWLCTNCRWQAMCDFYEKYINGDSY